MRLWPTVTDGCFKWCECGYQWVDNGFWCNALELLYFWVSGEVVNNESIVGSFQVEQVCFYSLWGIQWRSFTLFLERNVKHMWGTAWPYLIGIPGHHTDPLVLKRHRWMPDVHCAVWSVFLFWGHLGQLFCFLGEGDHSCKREVATFFLEWYELVLQVPLLWRCFLTVFDNGCTELVLFLFSLVLKESIISSWKGHYSNFYRSSFCNSTL